MAIAIVTVFASCSNDDVTISRTANFTVNPSTVIEPYVTKFSYILDLWDIKGELESFNTTYKLRVRTFVYDSNGVLVKKLSGEYNNYDVKLKESAFLPVGSYTAVAITDIYRPSDNFEYWEVSGSDQLATLKITDTGYFGDARTILGTTKQTFSIGETSVDINIDVKPAGALFLVLYSNIFTFSDVSEYELSVNKLQSSIEFNSYGDYTISTENHNGSFDWRINSVKLEDIDQSQYSSARRWATQLPMNNVGVCFSAWIDDTSSSTQLGSGKTWDIKAEDGYFCWLYLQTSGYDTDYLMAEEVESWLNAASSRRAPNLGANIAPLRDPIKDVKRHDATVGQYLYPKNLK